MLHAKTKDVYDVQSDVYAGLVQFTVYYLVRTNAVSNSPCYANIPWPMVELRHHAGYSSVTEGLCHTPTPPSSSHAHSSPPEPARSPAAQSGQHVAIATQSSPIGRGSPDSPHTHPPTAGMTRCCRVASTVPHGLKCAAAPLRPQLLRRHPPASLRPAAGLSLYLAGFRRFAVPPGQSSPHAAAAMAVRKHRPPWDGC